jgi:hypothetical protein
MFHCDELKRWGFDICIVEEFEGLDVEFGEGGSGAWTWTVDA